jgi:predicted CXXCH cytochrome family protein
MEFGCSSCHSTHKSEPQVTPEGVFHLVEAQPDLCVTCHDTEDDAFRGSHSNQPVATAECTLCHNPHGSDNAKLINNTVHGALEMGCETCHEEPEGETVVLQEGAGRETCLMCHAEIEEQMGTATVIHGPLEMDSGCVNCHNPHATTSAKLLKRGPVETCFDCHTELAEARASMEYLHRPVFEAECNVCHQPHTGERERLLRAEANDLCLECHQSGIGRRVGVFERAERAMPLFEETAEIATALMKDIPTIRLNLGDTEGHPARVGEFKHPVSGKYPLGDNMSCVTCHEPHAAGFNQKLLRTRTARETICVMCH